LIFAHANEAVAPPSQFAPELPRDVEAVILKCLAKKPEDRFQDVGSLEQALASCDVADEWTQSLAEQWWRGRDADKLDEAEPAASEEASAETALIEVRL
jgi:serine/threonine-protein kinase